MHGQASRSIHGNRFDTVRIQEMTGGLSPRPGLRSESWSISEPLKRIDDGSSGSAEGYSEEAGGTRQPQSEAPGSDDATKLRNVRAAPRPGPFLRPEWVGFRIIEPGLRRRERLPRPWPIDLFGESLGLLVCQDLAHRVGDIPGG